MGESTIKRRKLFEFMKASFSEEGVKQNLGKEVI